MIADDKKLLCAFIYSAYESGFCNPNKHRNKEQSDKIRNAHKALCSNYVERGRYYPGLEIASTHSRLVDLIKISGIRDYIYEGHFELIKSEIKEAGISFEKVKESQSYVILARFCPIHYYQVLRAENNQITGKNLIPELNTERRVLKTLNGLEKPVVGDIVSAHWGFMLEVVNDLEDFERYFQLAKEYYSALLSK